MKKSKSKDKIPAMPDELSALIQTTIPPAGRFTVIRIMSQIELYGAACYRAGRRSAFTLEKQRRARRA
jgi:hypothetical protein